jgi:hypothetical protein
LVEEEDRDDNPADGKETVGGTQSGCKQREARRHVEGDESDCQRGCEASESGNMSLDAKAGHRYQEHEKRQGSKSGGEKPRTGGIVALRPRSCEVWRMLED